LVYLKDLGRAVAADKKINLLLQTGAERTLTFLRPRMIDLHETTRSENLLSIFFAFVDWAFHPRTPRTSPERVAELRRASWRRCKIQLPGRREKSQLDLNPMSAKRLQAAIGKMAMYRNRWSRVGPTCFRYEDN